MSESHLPDDVARWPRDPYRLLDVAPSIDKTNLKRAYLRLVRLYKPEQSPGEFQRIREAYETILHHIDNRSINIQEVLFDARSSGRKFPSRTEQTADRGHTLANLIGTDEIATAYDRLICDFEFDSGRTNVCLKLYWLLVANPGLDSERHAIDWLYRGLAASSGESSAAMMIVRRAVELNPSLAFRETANTLIDPSLPPAFLLEFTKVRWGAARILNRWREIEFDLDALRVGAFDALEADWPFLLSIAARNLLWGDERRVAAARSFISEIELWGYLTQYDRVLDELEMRLIQADAHRTLDPSNPLMAALIRLLPKVADVEPEQVKRIAMPLIKTLAENLNTTLASLDNLAQKHRQAFAALATIVDAMRPSPESDLIHLGEYPVRALIDGTKNWSAYQKRRLDVLQFCTQEALDPAEFGKIASNVNKFSHELIKKVGVKIAEDYPLQYAYRIWATARAATV